MINQNVLNDWYEITQRMAADKLREIELRKQLFGAAFPDPTEGSKDNKFSLADGWVLQGDYKINRTIDAAVVSTLMKGDNTRPIVENVVEYKPSLVLAKWKGLDTEDRALLADMVTEKPGSPTLKIVKPKKG